MPTPIIINDGICLDLRKGHPFEKILKLAKKYQVFLYIDGRRNTAVLFTAHDKKNNKYIAGGICMPIMRTGNIDYNITLDYETVDGLEVRETILNCGARLEDVQTAAQAAEAPAVEDSTLEDVQTAAQADDVPAVASDDGQPDQLPEPTAVVYVSEPCPPTPRRRRRGFRPATFRRPFSRVAASLLVFVVAAVLSFSWPPVEGAHATAAAMAAVTLPEVTVTADVMPAPQEGTQSGTIDSPTADHANNGSTSHALTAAQDGQTAVQAAELPAVEDSTLEDGQPGTIDSPAADHTSDGGTLAPSTASGSAPCWYTCTASYNSPATHVYPLS